MRQSLELFRTADRAASPNPAVTAAKSLLAASLAKQLRILQYNWMNTAPESTGCSANIPTAICLAHFPARAKRRSIASIDAGAGSTVDIDTKEFCPEWSANVLRAAAIGTSDQKPAAGKHTLTIRPRDPGIVFDKIVNDLGGLKPSYLGPPETTSAIQ